MTRAFNEKTEVRRSSVNRQCYECGRTINQGDTYRACTVFPGHEIMPVDKPTMFPFHLIGECPWPGREGEP